MFLLFCMSICYITIFFYSCTMCRHQHENISFCFSASRNVDDRKEISRNVAWKEWRHRSTSHHHPRITHILECWIYLNLKRNSLQKPDFLFRFQIHSSDFYCFEFLEFHFSRLRIRNTWKNLVFIEFLLSFSLVWHIFLDLLLWERRVIRLVKRRVEKHQQHSITHTSFTEKYVSCYLTEQVRDEGEHWTRK